MALDADLGAEDMLPDAPPDLDMDMAPDAQMDMAPDADMPPELRTLADYRRCRSNAECPVGLGRCVTEVPLNRPDAQGRTAVPLREVFAELAVGEGFCTEVCTTNPGACEALSMNGVTRDPQPHTCQLIVTFDHPYPETRPAFPFADQLDPQAQLVNAAFGAICRPPFGLDPAIPDSFCQGCALPTDCGADSVCADLARLDLADGAGTCLSVCADDSQCPAGFACQRLGAGGEVCVPTIGTCDGCQDRDRDGRGAGRCGQGAQPITAHDCDDRSADAYFDPMRPERTFPSICAVVDNNCNGLSDDVEQIGTPGFGDKHCTACGDVCDDAALGVTLANAVHGCRQRVQPDGSSVPACVAVCDRDAQGQPTHADCDGDASNGCEVAIDDPSRVYYRDADGDGRGDPADSAFSCQPGQVPAGYVANHDDCDDSNPLSYGAGAAGPAAVELCDGEDNSCDGQVDVGIAQVGQLCSNPALLGSCSVGAMACMGAAGLVCVTNQPTPELCSTPGDDDCDGFTNEADAQTADILRFFPDLDGDLYSPTHLTPLFGCVQPVGTVLAAALLGADCDDGRADVNPGAIERCSAIPADENCDGQVDEGTVTAANMDPALGQTQIPGSRPVWIDADRDGVRAAATPTYYSCNVAADGRVRRIGQLLGYTARVALDCDDTRGNVFPLSSYDVSGPVVFSESGEVCDGLDNNCDGDVDNFSGRGNACGTGLPGVCSPGTQQCRQDPMTMAWSLACVQDMMPLTDMTCNAVDEDCDGQTEDGCIRASQRGTMIVNATGSAYPSTGNARIIQTCPGNKVAVGITFGSVPGEPQADRPSAPYLLCAELMVKKTLEPNGLYSYILERGAVDQMPQSLANTGTQHPNILCSGLSEVVQDIKFVERNDPGATLTCVGLKVGNSPGSPILADYTTTAGFGGKQGTGCSGDRYITRLSFDYLAIPIPPNQYLYYMSDLLSGCTQINGLYH